MLSEEEIIKEMESLSPSEQAIQGLLDLYNKEKEKNIKAGELLGKRINMCNQFQIELDKEKEKNKELDKIKFIITDNLPPDMKYVCYCNTDFERLFGNDYISKDKIKEIAEDYESKGYIEIAGAMRELLEERN